MNINELRKTNRAKIKTRLRPLRNPEVSFVTMTSLTAVPAISFSFVEEYVKKKSLSSGTTQMSKGYKYYSEGYVFDMNTSQLSGCSRISCKCYRSMRKNEAPHRIEMFIDHDPVSVKGASCSCAIGISGACGHIAGTLYLLAHYKQKGMPSVPADVARTSLPMTWHIPRSQKICGSDVDNIVVRGYDRKNPERSTKSIQSTLYNPLRTPLQNLDVLREGLEKSDEEILLLAVLKSDRVTPPMVKTKFGLAPKGSILSHQQREDDISIVNILQTEELPRLPIQQPYMESSLNPEQQEKADRVAITQREAFEIETSTQSQSSNPIWQTLRCHRVTASRAGEIFKKTKGIEQYVHKMKNPSTRTTQPMRLGIVNEPVAAAAYARTKLNKVNVYPCGIVISHQSPWLGASPDRKVFDPASTPKFGLLEIKCPENKIGLSSLPYLRSEGGELSLKKNHNYYFQVQMQMGVCGLSWCDFYVWSDTETHLERIVFSHEFFSNMKQKLDEFYFRHY